MPYRRELFKQKIPFDRGTLVPGTNVTVFSCKGLSNGRGSFRGACFYASRDGIAVPGVYADGATAALVALKMTTKQIIEHLGPIYEPQALNRPVTLADFNALRP